MLKCLCHNNGAKLHFTRHFQPFLLFSTTPSSSTPTQRVTSSFANYLVSSLGFSHQKSLSTSSKLTKCRGNKRVSDFSFAANADSVIDFFKEHGFDDAHIRKVVTCEPRNFTAKVERTLEPKFKLLLEMGFSGSDIVDVISGNPRIILVSFYSSILPAVQAMRDCMGCDAGVIDVMKKPFRFSSNTILNCMLPNVALLRSYGIPVDRIRKNLISTPNTFSRKPEMFENAVIRVEQELGIPRDSPMFFLAVRLLTTLSEKSIESRCQVLRSFGWTQSDVNTFIMKNPFCLYLSDATLKKKLDFLMKELCFTPAYLTSRCGLLTCSLEKRVVPRHKVWMILKEKGLTKRDYSLYELIWLNESRFLERFVIPFKEVHEVYPNYKKDLIPGC